MTKNLGGSWLETHAFLRLFDLIFNKYIGILRDCQHLLRLKYPIYSLSFQAVNLTTRGLWGDNTVRNADGVKGQVKINWFLVETRSDTSHPSRC